jgi:hypothetical protein
VPEHPTRVGMPEHPTRVFFVPKETFFAKYFFVIVSLNYKICVAKNITTSLSDFSLIVTDDQKRKATLSDVFNNKP